MAEGKNGKKKEREYVRVIHEFDPVWDENSRILILGSIPSVKSREAGFYYGNPQNRFWKVIAALTGREAPESIPEKKRMLLENQIAVWDVIASCRIAGSDDGSIRDVAPNDIAGLLEKSRIEKIYANGGKAFELYRKYVFPETGVEAARLPSTSPANASWSLERLTGRWGEMLGL